MTEYGRSPGSEPWHPTDPLYGDQGWEGQQQQYPQQAQYGHQDPHGQQQAYPGDQQQGYVGDPYAHQQPPQYQQPQTPYQQYPQGHAQQQFPQDQHQQQAQQQHAPQQYGQDPYPQDPHQPQYPQEQYGEQQQYGQQPGGYDTPGYPAQPYDGHWETGQAAMPYNAAPADPYGGQQPDLYGTPDAYPPPQPPGPRRQVPPQPVTDWDAEPAEEDHPFFTGKDEPAPRRDDRAAYDDQGDDEGDDEPDGDEEPGGRRGARGGGGRERRGGKGRKAKNGMACLVVAAVIVGGVGGLGYLGYTFWQGQFGAAPDYAGEGSGDVQVEIPKGALGYDIGNILKKAGVVKSVDAFVSAQQKNPKGISIQAGVYTLKKEMSAESAVAMMLNPASQANFVIPEGRRNSWVYAEVDKRLGLKPGTTKDTAFKQAGSLGLPDWAKNHAKLKDPLEGFLFPASYPLAKGTKPEEVLRRMVARSNEEYTKLDIEAKAKEVGLEGPWQLLTAASLVQAEGKTHDDFTKMAEVIYNRMSPDNKETMQLLQFDSSYNYLRGQSKIKITRKEVLSNPDPYNTYTNRGLPPGPIGNPGKEAIQAAMNPTKDGWLYFVATDGMNKTEFAKTLAEHDRLVAKFNAEN
ncbi:endolytic transglycosylase MltG [Streptomyces sp. NPDC090025]|uniref:endolytic transglycosylase MltG n=1 Tax=Streptomyces sp. NPDC090025 TaxID=3365922 RepID=UPI003832CFF6